MGYYWLGIDRHLPVDNGVDVADGGQTVRRTKSTLSTRLAGIAALRTDYLRTGAPFRVQASSLIDRGRARARAHALGQALSSGDCVAAAGGRFDARRSTAERNRPRVGTPQAMRWLDAML